MRTFVEAVRAQGFAAAAKALDLPRSTASKQVQALERMLGVQLLMRTTRSLHLTEAGASYYEAAQEVLAALDEAEERVRDGSASLRGTLRINAPISFGMRVLGPLLPAFHARHPEVELQLAMTDQLVDPVRGGFDVTIRIANLQDSSLVARQLLPAPRWLVAAPSYLARAGTPSDPRELASHAFLHYGLLQGGVTLALGRGDEVRRVALKGPLAADNGDLLAAMAEAGMGIALLPEFIVAEALAAGRLVVVLEDWQAPPIAVHVLFPSARNLPRRTRRFVEFLVERLRP